MRKLASVVFALMLLGLSFPKVADVAEIEWLGRISALGGAESESWRRRTSTASARSHGLGMAEALGVIPIWGPFGLQLDLNFQGGDGPQVTGYAGPIFDFGFGKAGVFIERQYNRLGRCAACDRYRNIHNTWVTPSLSFYDLIPGTNIDLWHKQIVTGGAMDKDADEGDANKHYYGYSATRLAVNYFPPPFLPFIGRDNLELTLGVQLNGLSGPGHTPVRLGVGPAFGMSVVPVAIAGVPVEWQMFKAFIDNRNRYRVTSGVQVYLSKGTPTLMQLRRKYLEPTNLPGSVSTFYVF